MNKTVKTVLVSTVAVLLFALLVCISFFSNRIKQNDPTTLGNTAGNLANGGLFCEYDGDVYFSNNYDDGVIYKISGKDGSVKRVNTNGNCYSINVAGDYIYFCMASAGKGGKGLGSVVRINGVYRSKLNGKSTTCLNTSPSVAMQLYGNDLYYQQTTGTGTILVKQSTDKKKKEVLSEDLMSPVSIVNGTIYYHGTTENHFLYGMDTVSGKASLMWPENVWDPIYQNGYIYYISLDGKYNLCRHSLSGEGVEVLCRDRVDCFNVYNDIIYYAVSAGDAPALKRMHLDGSANEVVREGIYHNINITSSNVYFTPYDSPIPVYVQSTYGAVATRDFSEAAAAVLQENKK